MGTYVGADWASKGWIAAELDEDGELDVGFYPTIWNLWYEYEDDDLEQILVDIPIGLPDGETRTCDEDARDFLEERWNSVFSTPTRNAVYEDHIYLAKAEQKSATGSSISNQSWAIVPRIREVDTFLRQNDEAQDVIRESHPEVCFRALNGKSIEAKSSDGGIEARREVLESEPEITIEDCNRAVAILAEPNYARFAAEDDVLDAIVLAVTAKRIAEGDYSRLPSDTEMGDEHPPTDGEGLPMEIVYPDP